MSRAPEVRWQCRRSLRGLATGGWVVLLRTPVEQRGGVPPPSEAIEQEKKGILPPHFSEKTYGYNLYNL